MKNIKYPILTDNTLYLYNTETKTIEKTFKDIYDVRTYISKEIEREREYGFDHILDFPKKLTMSLEPTTPIDFITREFSYGLTHDSLRHLVIIDKNHRIFNYTEIVNELIAYDNKQQIAYGIGHTYKGPSFDATTKPKRIRDTLTPWLNFAKHHYRSAPHKVISCREITETLDYPDDIISEIAEECDTQTHVVEKACKSMRSGRKSRSIGYWDDEAYNYDRPYEIRSWKGYKRKAQWSKAHTSIRRQSKSERLMDEIINDYNASLETARDRYLKRCEENYKKSA